MQETSVIETNVLSSYHEMWYTFEKSKQIKMLCKKSTLGITNSENQEILWKYKEKKDQ